MILSKEFYDRCSPSYKKAVDELEEKIADIKSHTDDKISVAKEIYLAIMQFSRSYLTPKEYWNASFSALYNIHGKKEWIKPSYKVAVQAYFHFQENFYIFHRRTWFDDALYRDGAQYKESLNYMHFRSIEFYDEDGDFPGLHDNVRDISYPHSCLKECMRSFEYCTSRLPSKELVERYEKMIAVYHKIKAAEGDMEQWIKAMAEADNCMFVKDNVEPKLGKDYFNGKLWKLYLAYLKESGNYKLLLETYSKYCRFFLDDHEMLEEYKKDMLQYGPVDLPWDNLFDFEWGMVENEEVENVEKKEILPLDKKLCAAFYDIYQSQKLSLPGPLIFYLLKKASNQVLRKLFSSCKYFFAQQPTPVCYRLTFEPDAETQFYDESLIINGSTNLDLVLKNAYITGSIDFDDCSEFPNDLMSRIISRLYRCDAKYIHLDRQNLSLKELKFLLQHGGVVAYQEHGSKIYDESGDYVELEAIMELLPNIESLVLYKVKVTAKTAQCLTKQKFNAKIQNLRFDVIYGEPFDPAEFLKFCIANKNDEEFYLDMYFNQKFDAAFVDNFKKMITTKSDINTHYTVAFDRRNT